MVKIGGKKQVGAYSTCRDGWRLRVPTGDVVAVAADGVRV